MGTQLPPRKKAQPPLTQFLTHVYCGQTAGYIKMALGTEVNIGPGDVVLDGVAAPPKGAQPPVFGSCLFWPNDFMDEGDSWYGSRPRPRPYCVRRGPSSQLPRETGTADPHFPARPMSIVATVGRPSQLLLSTCCSTMHQRHRQDSTGQTTV